MSDKELIAEAKSRMRGDIHMPGRVFLTGVIDALEARQPTENDREALVRVVANHPIAPLMRLGGDAGYPLADAILAAGFSRAAVPDAATEELLKRVEEAETQSAEDRVEWQQMKERASQRFNAYQQKKRELRQMEVRAEKAQAERDAALAAIERVRAEADAYAEQPDVMELCGAVAQALRTALDGAPEPETPELFPGTNAALDRLTVRKAAPAEAFCIEHGNFHAVELGDPTCEFEDGFGEPVDGEKP